MIKTLTSKHTAEILNYCLENEHENFFTISRLFEDADPFQNMEIIAKYENDKIVSLLTFFTDFQNLVVHSNSKQTIKELLDKFPNIKSIKYVVCYKKFADTILEHLKQKYNLVPTKKNIEDVFQIKLNTFKNHTKSNSDYRIGQTNQKQEIAEFSTIIDQQPIDQAEPDLIKPHNEYLLYKNNQLVAKAALHGKTKNYFQIGGVGTLKEHRRKGYAKEIVSFICQENLNTRTGILFTGEDNIAAQKVYQQLGFSKFDKLILATFKN